LQSALGLGPAPYCWTVPPLQTNDLEQAVQLFAEVLQVRTEHYGGATCPC